MEPVHSGSSASSTSKPQTIWKRLGGAIAVGSWVLLTASCGGVTVDEASEPAGGAEAFASETTGAQQEALHTVVLLQPTSSPSVCFVRARNSTAFASQMSTIQAAMTQWEDASGLDFVFLGECAPPVGGQYPGDIRIYINEGSLDPVSHEWVFEPMSGRIPGCSDTLEGPNSGGFPYEFPRTCQYNASFSAFQAINNYLHESGHTLGFAHEHIRTATPAGCENPTEPLSNGLLLTPYDHDSVMHYATCGASGNLGTTGLSYYDRLGAEIAYPKGTNIPITRLGGMAYDGGVAFRADQGGVLFPTWFERGALNTVFGNFTWTVDGSVSSGLVRAITGNLGPVTATMHFTDPWGRSQSGSMHVVADNAAHAAMVMVSTE